MIAPPPTRVGRWEVRVNESHGAWLWTVRPGPVGGEGPTISGGGGETQGEARDEALRVARLLELGELRRRGATRCRG